MIEADREYYNFLNEYYFYSDYCNNCSYMNLI